MMSCVQRAYRFIAAIRYLTLMLQKQSSTNEPSAKLRSVSTMLLWPPTNLLCAPMASVMLSWMVPMR